MQLAPTYTTEHRLSTLQDDQSHLADGCREVTRVIEISRFLENSLSGQITWHHESSRPDELASLLEPLRSREIAQRESEQRSSDAACAFINIMDHWKITDDDARQLLGEVSKDAYTALKNESGQVLDEDKIRRISYLVGIFKALNALYSERLADRWMQLPNKNRIFGGMTPHDYLMQGGLPEFATVRSLLDARRHGY